MNPNGGEQQGERGKAPAGSKAAMRSATDYQRYTGGDAEKLAPQQRNGKNEGPRGKAKPRTMRHGSWCEQLSRCPAGGAKEHARKHGGERGRRAGRDQASGDAE